jgi:hypothetical protein
MPLRLLANLRSSLTTSSAALNYSSPVENFNTCAGKFDYFTPVPKGDGSKGRLSQRPNSTKHKKGPLPFGQRPISLLESALARVRR